MNPKDPIIRKEVNNLNKWRKVEGIIDTQLKYARKAFWVDLTVKYKTTAAPINASTEAKDAELAVAVDAAVKVRP